jgi:hypothetical protein
MLQDEILSLGGVVVAVEGLGGMAGEGRHQIGRLATPEPGVAAPATPGGVFEGSPHEKDDKAR